MQLTGELVLFLLVFGLRYLCTIESSYFKFGAHELNQRMEQSFKAHAKSFKK